MARPEPFARTSSGRKATPVTEPSRCRSCKADVLWARWETGKRMPADFPSDNRPMLKGGGNLVLTLRGGEFGELLVEHFDLEKHGLRRNRYTSHFATCPNAKDWRSE
jgi:hypothetical protein